MSRLALSCALVMLVAGCGMSRARWQMHRDLLAADRLADDGLHYEARAAYIALAPAIERPDLLAYTRYRAALMLERAGDAEAALEAYAAIYRTPTGVYDHTAGQAMFRTAEILRDVYDDEAAAVAAFESVIQTFPNTLFADDALIELIDHWREVGATQRLYAFLTENYVALQRTEIADNLAYWTARVLQDDLGRPAEAIEVYRILILNFHPSGLVDDSVWRTAVCLRTLDRIDEEYWLLKAFVDSREVSWVMADYESEYYRPSLERMAEIHEERGELPEAIAVYQRFVRMYPLSLLRDDTQYRVMELQRELGDIDGMEATLRWMRRETPESRFIGRGEALLAEAVAGR